jgi:hypothetical protein
MTAADGYAGAILAVVRRRRFRDDPDPGRSFAAREQLMQLECTRMRHDQQADGTAGATDPAGFDAAVHDYKGVGGLDPEV